MSKIEYVQRAFKEGSLAVIHKANDIIEEYERQGYPLTLRQLYYQFVSRDLIANKQTEYKRLGSIINDGRLAGLIDWNAIIDRTRNLRGNNHYNNPGEFLNAIRHQYHVDSRQGQEAHVEVWVEKDALIGVVERSCQSNDVDFFACRGYVSQSEQHNAALRILDKLNQGDHERAVIIHLGDHDPSGVDMTRDIQDRMNLFLSHHGNGSCEVRRIALNMDQVKQYNPPPNPAKLTDSRCAKYIAEHGSSSWELDALEPRVIERLIHETIEELTDPNLRESRLEHEREGDVQLRKIADDIIAST